MTITETGDRAGSYIEWPVILAGAVLACAVTTVLIQFGAVAGLTQISPSLTPDQNITPGKVLGAGVWLLWVQILSSLAGGYLAGRMRMPVIGASEHERDMRDGVHGLLVWATATLAVVVAVSAMTAIAALADNPAEDIAQAADVAAMEERSTVIFAFFAASSSLASGVISWWIATVGGDHRDTKADHARYFSFRA